MFMFEFSGHLNGVQEAAGSTPVTRTIKAKGFKTVHSKSFLSLKLLYIAEGKTNSCLSAIFTKRIDYPPIKV